MTRKATIAALRADLDATQRNMWEVAIENVAVAQECKRLQAIVDRQDETLLALWQMLEEKEKADA